MKRFFMGLLTATGLAKAADPVYDPKHWLGQAVVGFGGIVHNCAASSDDHSFGDFRNGWTVTLYEKIPNVNRDRFADLVRVEMGKDGVLVVVIPLWGVFSLSPNDPKQREQFRETYTRLGPKAYEARRQYVEITSGTGWTQITITERKDQRVEMWEADFRVSVSQYGNRVEDRR